jgi:hypothetical protein
MTHTNVYRRHVRLLLTVCLFAGSLAGATIRGNPSRQFRSGSAVPCVPPARGRPVRSRGLGRVVIPGVSPRWWPLPTCRRAPLRDVSDVTGRADPASPCLDGVVADFDEALPLQVHVRSEPGVGRFSARPPGRCSRPTAVERGDEARGAVSQNESSISSATSSRSIRSSRSSPSHPAGPR